MTRILAFLALGGLAAIAAIVLTREPTALGVLVVIVAGAVSAASLAALLLLRYAAVGRSARARASRAAALRRGVELGAVVGLIATLRVIDGLTPLTALFVVLSFVIAEYVLSAGMSRST